MNPVAPRLYQLQAVEGPNRAPLDIAQIEELIEAGAVDGNAVLMDLSTGRSTSVSEIPRLASAVARRQAFEEDLFDLAAARTNDLIVLGENSGDEPVPESGNGARSNEESREPPRPKTERLLSRVGLELLALAEKHATTHAPGGPIDWVAWAAREMERASVKSAKRLFGSLDLPTPEVAAPIRTSDLEPAEVVGMRPSMGPAPRTPSKDIPRRE